MDSTLPLFQLPERAIMTSLKYCGVPELIIFSILSKRAKHMVKSDKRNARSIEIINYTGCIVVLYSGPTIMFGESQQRDCDVESLTPCTLRATKAFPPSEISFTVPGFGGVKNWLEHFMFIFNHPMANVSFGPRDLWKYSLESVRSLLKGLPIGNLRVFENACEIIRNFPIMHFLHIDKTDLEPELPEAELNFIKKVLVGNMDSLKVYRVVPIDLNTLLTFNSSDIRFNRTSITDKQLNTFLKLWLNGAKQNLRSVYIDFVGQRRRGLFLNTSVIMKGIKIEGSTNGRRFDIQKRDGTFGDVIISPCSFELRVVN
ncbi:hypothetical protein CAEBREN_24142 [Caenorhabditis brenneri]|uniref:F-box domain-containing protein n=1 Tax=Caenorhabditis brenneri TaxID=135651 RepID=G0MX96_CAEBE|nr:hypothetical protein CAEBREN_24142 [Caenorhabditis brenneri]